MAILVLWCMAAVAGLCCPGAVDPFSQRRACLLVSPAICWEGRSPVFLFFFFWAFFFAGYIMLPIGSMVLVYMLTWLGYIDGIHVTIYTSTMDPSWVISCVKSKMASSIISWFSKPSDLSTTDTWDPPRTKRGVCCQGSRKHLRPLLGSSVSVIHDLDDLEGRFPWLRKPPNIERYWTSLCHQPFFEMGMDQYLLINTILRGMNIHTSQLFWCELQGYLGFWHTAICFDMGWTPPAQLRHGELDPEEWPEDEVRKKRTSDPVVFFSRWLGQHVGLSENSVPLNPMVNDHYPY